MDFIGIGAQKAGSTWIADCLREHPQLCLPVGRDGQPIKELHHFDAEQPMADAELQACFSHAQAGQLLGEFTPRYMHDARAMQRIRQAFPEAKLIISLRNPVDRALSNYKMVQRASGQMSFAEACRISPDILTRGDYLPQLERVLQLFDRAQVHIALYDDIAKDPQAFMREIYTFLGVDADFVAPSTFGRSNVGRNLRPRYVWLDRLRGLLRLGLRRSAWGLAVIRWIRALGGQRLDARLRAFNQKGAVVAQEPQLDAEKAQLRVRYAPGISELERFLQRSLDSWR